MPHHRDIIFLLLGVALRIHIHFGLLLCLEKLLLPLMVPLPTEPLVLVLTLILFLHLCSARHLYEGLKRFIDTKWAFFQGALELRLLLGLVLHSTGFGELPCARDAADLATAYIEAAILHHEGVVLHALGPATHALRLQVAHACLIRGSNESRGVRDRIMTKVKLLLILLMAAHGCPNSFFR